MRGLVVTRVLIDTLFVLKLPEHEGRLLLHVVEYFDLVDEVGDGAYLSYESVYLLFEIVVHDAIVDKVKDGKTER